MKYIFLIFTLLFGGVAESYFVEESCMFTYPNQSTSESFYIEAESGQWSKLPKESQVPKELITFAYDQNGILKAVQRISNQGNGQFYGVNYCIDDNHEISNEVHVREYRESSNNLDLVFTFQVKAGKLENLFLGAESPEPLFSSRSLEAEVDSKTAAEIFTVGNSVYYFNHLLNSYGEVPVNLLEKMTIFSDTQNVVDSFLERGVILKPSVRYLLDQEIVSGYPDGTFRLHNTINRAEFLKIALKAKGWLEEGRSCDLDFPDVQPEDWYHDYICEGVKQGFLQGYPDGRFHPERNVKFAEASKILVSLFSAKKIISDEVVWYQHYLDYLNEQNAVPESVKVPGQNLTRGEVAEMVYRLLKPKN